MMNTDGNKIMQLINSNILFYTRYPIAAVAMGATSFFIWAVISGEYKGMIAALFAIISFRPWLIRACLIKKQFLVLNLIVVILNVCLFFLGASGHIFTFFISLIVVAFWAGYITRLSLISKQEDDA